MTTKNKGITVIYYLEKKKEKGTVHKNFAENFKKFRLKKLCNSKSAVTCIIYRPNEGRISTYACNPEKNLTFNNSITNAVKSRALKIRKVT